MEKFDLRIASIATLMKKVEKSIMTEDIKDAIRNNKITTIANGYGKIKLKPYTQKKFTPEDQAKIDKFIEDNHIEKITETKENYSIEIIPSEKAETEFDKMLDRLDNDPIDKIKDQLDIALSTIQEVKKAIYSGGDTQTAMVHAEYELNALVIAINKATEKKTTCMSKVASAIKMKREK